MEQHIERLSTEQRRQGVEVVNLYNMGQGPDGSVQVWSGLDLLRVKPSLLRNAIFYAGGVGQRRRLRSDAPTVLHVHGAWSDFALGKALAAAIGAHRLFASMHGKLRPDLPWLHRAALGGYSGVFATGYREAEYLRRAWGGCVVHLPSGPSDLFFDVQSEQAPLYDALAVGALKPLKRMDLVIACAARRPDLRFAIVGDGPLQGALEAQIVEAGAANIALLGRRSTAEVAVLMGQSRLLLSTSEEEGSPTAAMEAMAAGLPLVLAPANDFSAIVRNGEGGFVTAGWSVDELLARIDTVLADEDRRRAMGAGNRERARRHAWPVIAREVTARMRASLEPSR